MPTPSNSRGDNPNKYHHPTTYFIEERFSKEETARLVALNQVATAGMGGLMPDQPDPGSFGRVLDVACGPGGWLLDLAQTYPGISELVGVDINARMIAFATQEAAAHQLGGRARFQTMDVLNGLDFPDNSFDLVNQRLATSFVRTWDWSKLLNEMKRVTRTGGVVRLTEGEAMGTSNSSAVNQIIDLGIESFYQSGHLFSSDRRSVVNELPKMLRRYGFLDIETRAYTIEYSTDTPEGKLGIETSRAAIRTIQPFLSKWTRLPSDFEEISKQAVEEMQRPDFVITWPTTTIWARVPAPTPLIGREGES